jgi:type I restriction enzyme S subunit
LRFPGFEGEWRKYKISDILELFPTNSLSWEQLEYETDNIYNLHYGLIHKGIPTQIDLEKSTLPNIKTEFIPNNYTICEEGDVAFADASEDTNDIAKVVEFYNCNNKKIVCGLHTIHGRDKLGLTITGYKGYAFSANTFRHQIRKLAQGTKIFSISTKNFNESYICIPAKKEQGKIANLMFLIDQRIQAQSKIIEKYKSLIKGIVDFHFRGCKHKTYLIKELGEYFNVINLSKENLSEKGKECILYGELFTTYGCVINEVKSKTTKNDSKLTLSSKNDLLFPSSTTVDAYSLISPSAILREGVILGGDMFGIHVNENFNNEYLSYLFNYIYKNELARYAKGSTIVHLHYNEIKNAKIEIPSLDEQKRAVKVLGLLQERIIIGKGLLNTFQKQKEYLLQSLFI